MYNGREVFMASYSRMPKRQVQRLGSFEAHNGLGYSIYTGLLNETANPANWAASPTSTHSSWSSQLPGAKIASGHILSQRSQDGKVAVVKNGVAQTQYYSVAELAGTGKVLKNGAQKIVFCCAGSPVATNSTSSTGSSSGSTSSSSSGSNGSSSKTENSNDWGSILTGAGSILTAGLGPALSIYTLNQQTKLQKEALRQQGAAGSQPVIVQAPSAINPAVILAIAVVVVIMFMGGLFMLSKNSSPKAKKAKKRRK